MIAKTISLTRVEGADVSVLAPLIADLIRATGPVSYDYQF